MEEQAQVTNKQLETITRLTETKGFVGKEFLTWLWFFAETGNQALHIEEDKRSLAFNFWIDDRLILQPADGSTHVHMMRGGNPSYSHEAATALFSGKIVKELKIGLQIDSVGEYTAVLSHQDLNPRSLQLPVVDFEIAEEGSSAVLMRVEQTQLFLKALDALFEEFMSRRLKKEWEQVDLKRMQEWASARLEKVSGKLH